MATEIDVEKIRADFPKLDQTTFLASASVAPMPFCTIKAMRETLEAIYVEQDQRYWEELDIPKACKQSAAKLLNAEPEEVALVHSTTEGINAFASGIPWEKGDNIVINDLEYPANVLPWCHQAKRHGFEVRTVESRNNRIPPERIAQAADSRTKVIAVSHVEFANGFKHDLGILFEIAQENGALLFVDAIQSVGAMEVDVKEQKIDALSAGGYKWLCGPIDTGIMYVREGLIEELRPSYIGFGSIAKDEEEKMWKDLLIGRPHVRSYGRLAKISDRFEYGPRSEINFKGLQTSIDYLLSLNLRVIEERIAMLVDYLLQRLEEEGLQIETPIKREDRAGIVNFKPPIPLRDEREAEQFCKRLGDHNVRVNVRNGGVRVSCHFFNTEDDIEKALSAVRAVSRM